MAPVLAAQATDVVFEAAPDDGEGIADGGIEILVDGASLTVLGSGALRTDVAGGLMIHDDRPPGYAEFDVHGIALAVRVVFLLSGDYHVTVDDTGEVAGEFAGFVRDEVYDGRRTVQVPKRRLHGDRRSGRRGGRIRIVPGIWVGVRGHGGLEVGGWSENRGSAPASDGFAWW